MAVIPVHEFSKARVFYEKMLGLRLDEGASSESEAIYSLGDTRLLVYETQEELGGATKVTLEVKDLDKEMRDLKNHGIKFEDFETPNFKTTNGVVEDEHGKVAWFKDLEGNWIALSQPKS
jgi:catechol 2,3-dioxygenase-like lactoylglutathione lyase family enzyme